MILFRTHRDSPFIRDRYRFLLETSGLPVTVLFDRSGGKAGFEDIDTIDAGEEAYRALGLKVEADTGWRCGDYGFYLARRRFPDVARFWMVEFDALFSFPAAADFFARFDDSADLLAGRLAPAAEDWFWHRSARAAFGDAQVMRCLYPVVRLSAHAIDFLLEQRRRLSALPWDPDILWPNDESFTATGLRAGGFRLGDLNDHGRTYWPSLYRHEWPIPIERIGAPLDLLLHPVLDLAERMAKPYRFARQGWIGRARNGLKRTAWDSLLVAAKLGVARGTNSVRGVGD